MGKARHFNDERVTAISVMEGLLIWAAPTHSDSELASEKQAM